MIESYPIPAAQLIVEEEIKHSRFISLLFHCESADKLKSVLAQAKQDYPGASHYCYAFVAGAPYEGAVMGSSDDGEPAGSAGRPLLALLQGAALGEVGVIVIRYYGGTKLGVGGLVRAYTSGARQGLGQLVTEIKLLRYPARLTCDYAKLKDVEHLLKQVDAIVTHKQFAEEVLIEFDIPKAQQVILSQLLTSSSQGRLRADFQL
ncbi:MAG: YigZ family protein [Shewanella sp.]